MRRLTLLLTAMLLWPVLATAQTDNTRAEPGRFEASFQPRSATGDTEWLDIRRYGIVDHALTFMVTGGPSGVDVRLQCSNDGGATATSTIGTSTTTTGATISGSAVCTHVRVHVETLSGGTNPRVYPVYSGLASGQSLTVEGELTATIEGFATEAKQDTEIAHLGAIETATEALAAIISMGALPVTGDFTTDGLTDAELRATPVPVSGSLTNISGTISLPTGAATAANQSTANTSLSTIAGDTTDIETAVEVLDNAVGPVNAGAATATASFVAGGQYNLTPPTFTDGQQGSLQLSSDGSLKVTGGGGGTEYVVNAVAPANPTGNAPVAERDDALSALSEVEGDWTNLRANANGALWTAVDGTVTVSDGSGALNVIVDSGTITTVSTVSAVTAITNALPAGTNNIGDVDVLTLPSVTIGTFPDNEPINVAQMNGVTVAMGSGAVSTGVQRVTLANDSTGVLASIGSISTSITPGTAAANLGKAEDAVAASGDTGVAVFGVRRDSAASSAADGDYMALSLTSDGSLRVSGASGTTQYSEDAVHSSGDSVVFLGAIRRDTTPSSSSGTAGDYSALNVDANGRLYTNTVLYDAAGAAITPATDRTHDTALGTITSVTGPLMLGRASAAAPTNVSADDDAVAAWFLRNGSQVMNLAAGGTLITATSSSLNVACTTGCSGGTQYAEDLAHTTADLVTLAGVRRIDTVASSAGTSGDYALINQDANGRLYTQTVGGTAFDAAAASIDPLLIGCYASQAAPSDASADNDAVRLWCLRNGSQVVNLAAGGTLITSGNGAASGAIRVTVANDSTGTIAATIAELESLTHAEDAAHSSGQLGIQMLAVRQDTQADFGADGDYVPFSINADGELRVAISGATGIEIPLVDGDTDPITEDSIDALRVAWVDGMGNALVPVEDAEVDVAGVDFGPQVMLLAKDFDGSALPSAVSAEGDAVRPAASLSGVQYVMVVSEDGALERGTSTTPLVVDITGSDTLATVTTVSTVTTLSQLGGVALPIEDAGETAAGVGIYAMGVRRDTPASSAGTTGDNTMASYNALGAMWTTSVPSTTGGLSIFRSIDLDEGTGEVVKASAGQLYSMWVTNTATATRWIKIYNATSCTMGTGTPVITVGIPGNSSDDIAGHLATGGQGVAFSTGICIGATTGVADADTGAPGANDVIVNAFYF